jgi:hypothetical protein
MKKINLNGQEIIVLMSTKDDHYSEDWSMVLALNGTTLQHLTIENDLINGQFRAEWGLEVAEKVTLDSSDADFITLEALAWFGADAIIGTARAFNEMAREKTRELVEDQLASLREQVARLEKRNADL